jgi:hypothetical protein
MRHNLPRKVGSQTVEKTRFFGAESPVLLRLPLAKRAYLKTLTGTVKGRGGIRKQDTEESGMEG